MAAPDYVAHEVLSNGLSVKVENKKKIDNTNQWLFWVFGLFFSVLGTTFSKKDFAPSHWE